MTPLEGLAPLAKVQEPPLLSTLKINHVEVPSPFKSETQIFATVLKRIRLLTNQAKGEIAILAEEALPMQEELASREQEFINEANSRDDTKAKSRDEKKEMKAKHAEYRRIYEKEAAADIYLSQINEMTKEVGLPALTGETTLKNIPADIITEVERVGFEKSLKTQEYLLAQLTSELEVLSQDTGRREIIIRDLKDTMKNIVAAYPDLTGTDIVEDIHLALRTKMLSSVHKDRRADALSIGNHGSPHVLDWDTRVGADIGREMGMTKEEELQFRFAASFHDDGYTVPSVDRQLHEGKYWIDRRHEVYSAKVFRGLWQKGLFRGLFRDPQSLSTMHDAILNHAKIDKLDLKDPSIRVRNALIAADLASVYDRKIPYAFEVAPDIMLAAAFKIKVAKENIADPEKLKYAIDKIKQDAKVKAESDSHLAESSYALNNVLRSISQLSTATPDVLPGRLGYLEDMNHCGFDAKEGKIYFIFTKAPHEDIYGRSMLQALYGRKVEAQKEKAADEFEAVEIRKQAGVFLSNREVRIEFRGASYNLKREVISEKVANTVNALYSYNGTYMRINHMLGRLLDPTKNPETLAFALTAGTETTNLLYNQMKVIAETHFKRNGEFLSRKDMIAELTTDSGRTDLVKFLYAKRAKLAERILEDPKI